MSEVRVEVDRVWKKFRRGELHTSLRDLLPALGRRLFGRPAQRGQLRANDFWAVRDLSFQLRGGEALGIIGPNGAGKSTTLKILSRILRPNSGTVRIHGRLSALIEVAAGFHPDLTGRENIYLNGAILGMRRREIDTQLDAIIAFSGVEKAIDTPVKRYSSGMQARLGYAVAAHLEPDILLVDEVLSVGDAQFQRKCVENMKERLKKGTAVIFISHNMPAIVDLCPRALVLNAGVCVYDGPASEATARYMRLLRDGEARSSSGRVEVLGWKFEPPEGLLRPGEPFAFEFRVRFREALDCPTFGVIVHRLADQLRVYDMAMQECGLASRRYEAGEEATVRVRGCMNLLRGVYTLGFNIFIPSEHEFAYRDLYLFQFTIQEDSSYAGLVDLACEAEEVCCPAGAEA
jgi:lipopolysaccharide transport system ATP-binding protein